MCVCVLGMGLEFGFPYLRNWGYRLLQNSGFPRTSWYCVNIQILSILTHLRDTDALLPGVGSGIFFVFTNSVNFVNNQTRKKTSNVDFKQIENNNVIYGWCHKPSVDGPAVEGGGGIVSFFSPSFCYVLYFCSLFSFFPRRVV